MFYILMLYFVTVFVVMQFCHNKTFYFYFSSVVIFSTTLIPYIPVKSHAFSMRITLQGIKSRSHTHPHYSHANTNIDELKKFIKHNKAA